MIGDGAARPGRRRSWGRQHAVFEPPRPGAVPTVLFCVSSTLNHGQVADAPHGVGTAWRNYRNIFRGGVAKHFHLFVSVTI